MKHLRILSFLLLLLSAQAYAQSGWRDMEGNALPETNARRSESGFSAALIITPDHDWQAKWNTSPETVPHFTEASEVSDGGELFILTFLANPKVDTSSMADVACDFAVIRPNGSTSINELDMPCFKLELKTNPEHVYLSAASLKYVAEPEDPRGTWTVSVVVKDRNRGVNIPLRTSFVVR